MARVTKWIFVSSLILSTSEIVQSQSLDIRCYACTSINANSMLTEITDPNWLRWLGNIRNDPFSQYCKDDFQIDLALRDGVKSQQCANGVCMKMAFQETNGTAYRKPKIRFDQTALVFRAEKVWYKKIPKESIL